MSSASDIAAAAAAVHGRPSLLQQVISCDDSVRWGAGFQTTAMVVPAHACFSLSRGTSQAIAGSVCLMEHVAN
jgi:hypothetical protein